MLSYYLWKFEVIGQAVYQELELELHHKQQTRANKSIRNKNYKIPEKFFPYNNLHKFNDHI